jgi:CheY-like chemotaxis protein
MADRIPKILLVDDEAIVQEVLGKLLFDSGYEVTIAGTAEEAYSRFEPGSFDVALVDLMLPDEGGLEVLRRIKAADPDQPVILITAFGSIDEAGGLRFHYQTVQE